MIHYNTLLPSLSFSRPDFAHLGGTPHLTMAFGTVLAGMGAVGPRAMVRAHRPDHQARTRACARAGSQAVGWSAPHHWWVWRARARHLQVGSKHPGVPGQSTPRDGLWVGERTVPSILKFYFNWGGKFIFPPFCPFLNPNYSLYQAFHELVWPPSAQSSNSSKI